MAPETSPPDGECRLPPCPACGGTDVTPYVRTRRVATVRCVACRHLVAKPLVAPLAASGIDLHLQYDQGSFVDALRSTRTRQARLILHHARTLFPGTNAYVDYGAGRGWLLEECQRLQITPLAGLDTSRETVRLLRARGLEAHLLTGQEPLVVPELSFRPRVLLLLDVVEHFEPGSLRETLRTILDAFSPELQGVVIKVPLSSGVFFRAARRLAPIDPRLFERMFLVETTSPHWHYFSDPSLSALLSAVGLRPLLTVKDPDFEVDSLASRARVGRGRMAEALGRLAGRAALTLARGRGLQDSVIVFAAPGTR